MGEQRRIQAKPAVAVDQASLHRPRPRSAARVDGPVGARHLVALQRAVGNRAVAGLLAAAGTSLPVQRQPGQRVLPPRTQRWKSEEPYKNVAVMRRTTSIEATAWAEIGPAAPRILYRREIELKTTEGITVYLAIRGTVRLSPGTVLPSDPAAALAMRGRLVESQRTVRVDGGDVIPVNEYAPLQIQALSFGAVAKAVLPDYAQLPLTVAQQETAILAYVKTLPRQPKAVVEPDDGLGTVGVAADLVTDFIPFIGELKDLYRAVYGRDPVTGERLAWWEQALAFIGAIPLLGKLSKVVGKGIKHLHDGIKFLSKRIGWLRTKGAAFGGWIAEKLEHWLQSRKAKKLAKAQTDVRRLAEAESELKRLSEARRLAMTAAPTLAEVQRLVPAGTDWVHWGVEIFGQGPGQALTRIGTRGPSELLAIGVNKDVAQALYNWYRAVGPTVGGQTRLNRLRLLEHIIGLF